MTEPEIIGYVAIGLAALAGLFFTVGKPIISLNKTLTRFDITLDRLSKDFDKHVVISKDEFGELCKKEEEQDDKLENHEGRIIRLETKKSRKTTAS